MAIANNNVQNVKFLRNGNLYATHEAALTAINNEFGSGATVASDGTAILARYGSGTEVKTLVGFIYFASNDSKSLTILDVEGASADVKALRTEINNKLGEGVTSANTATAQFEALSGTNEDTSGTTSIAGAKKYADALISELDYSDEAVAGEYVSQVSEADGKISVTRVALPTVSEISEAGKPIVAIEENKGTISASAGTIEAQYVIITDSGEKFTATTVEGALAEVKDAISGLDYSDSAVAKNFVAAVNETDGVISVTRGELQSSGKTIVITADGNNVNFEANVDGETLIVDSGTGVISVASAALVQYEGDDNTIQIGAVSDGKRIVSSPLTIQKVTTGLSEEVKEEYHLVGHSGTTIGDPVKIYKDSHIVSINYITGSTDPHYQNLEYVYIDVSGNTQTTYVDMSELVLEAEFASGVTVTDGVAHGVVDPTSESFLTVGADGFKLSGVQNAINDAVDALDANVSGNSSHVTVGVDEVNGVITAVTVTEDNIANASDLAGLSGKTVTEITSTNNSISVAPSDAADGTVTYNVITDASKIQMSGFTSTEVLSGITTSSSITEAFSEVDKVITENEEVTAAALNDLDTRIKELSSGSTEALEAEIAARKAVDGINGSAYTATVGANYISNATSLNDADQKLDAAIKVVEGDLDIVETNYVSGMTVNGSALTKSDRVLAVTVTPATSATTATSTEAITVQTDANGNITLGLANIDCGTY